MTIIIVGGVFIMARKGQQFRKYKEEMMLSVIKEKIDTGKSYRYLSDKYHVSTGSIKTWVRRYRKER